MVFLSDGVYVNFHSRERIKAAFGDNYGRLVALKDCDDPDNVFGVNQNGPA